MAVLTFSTIHPVKTIFYIIESVVGEELQLDTDTGLAMAAWVAVDQGWSVEQIASVMMAESNLNVVADLVHHGSRLLVDAAPGREWLKGVAGRAMVYDRMTLVLIQEAQAGLPPPESDGGSSGPPSRSGPGVTRSDSTAG